jgi:hypothetical protein
LEITSQLRMRGERDRDRSERGDWIKSTYTNLLFSFSYFDMFLYSIFILS